MSETQPAPENQATPAEALFLPLTPAGQHYRRNHFDYPDLDPGAWRLMVDGAVERPLALSLAALRQGPHRALTVVLECAGHRRTEFQPPVAGVPWKTGALGQARWGGTPLAHVLQAAGVRSGAVEVVLYGADRGPFAGEPGEHPFARSLPLAKALHPDTLLAWEMNGTPLPREHGAPLRAVVPGWYAMDSVKWLLRIEVVTEPFRGPFQEKDYRFQTADDPGPGERLAAIPIHSLLLDPAAESAVPPGRTRLRGLAWGGSGGVARVEYRVNEGPWQPARLERPEEPYAWTRWEAEADLPCGECLVAVRATDGAGRSQPEAPVWNRRGYANHSIQRVRLRVG